jgi:hypothetical protein
MLLSPHYLCLYLNAFINLFMLDHLVLRQRKTINDEKLNLVIPLNYDPLIAM